MRRLVFVVALGAAVAALGCSSKSGGAKAGSAGFPGSDGGSGTTGSAGAGAGAGAAGNAAAAGMTGAAGAGAVAGSGAAGAAGTGADADVGLGFRDRSFSVLTRNKHQTRDGFFIQPTLTQSVAKRMLADEGFAAGFDGNLVGGPLYMEDGPGGKGAFFVGTTSNDVYALDETTGATVWKHSIGSAPAKTGVPCGAVMPVGILGTPVIDAATRTIYVAGAVGDAATIMRHEVHALSVDTGLERDGWPVITSALTAPGGVTFNAPAQNQRGALSLVGGILYVPYGGHHGDCGEFRGWVVAIEVANPTHTAAWATSGTGEGIWASGGLASAGSGVFAVTGNNTTSIPRHADSEEVVHVTGMAQVDRATGIFFPATWRWLDQQDLDFGSSSPVAFSVPDSTPSTLVGAVTKNGLFYLLDAANLGGMDGYVAQVTVAPETMSSVRAAPAAYNSTTGVHVIFPSLNTASTCPAGSPSYGGSSTVSILVSPGSPPTAKIAWCSIGSVSSPIATTTDGTHDPIVWIHAGALYALAGDTGEVLFSGLATDRCVGVHTMTSPIAVKGGRIILGADRRLCSYSPQ
jgi:outer membrane protein assembly factor BamB